VNCNAGLIIISREDDGLLLIQFCVNCNAGSLPLLRTLSTQFCLEITQ
jgi:hypothetical protein